MASNQTLWVIIIVAVIFVVWWCVQGRKEGIDMCDWCMKGGILNCGDPTCSGCPQCN